MLLFSPIYPKHEQRIAEIIQEEYPGVYVALSSVVLPVTGEVERWSTTMFSAYVAPAVAGYVSKIKGILKKEGFNGELLFIQSNGGTATTDIVIENPAVILLSGPAAGPSLGLALGLTHDVKNVLSVDMGGTSFDVGVVHDGIVDIVQQQIIDAKKYALPSVDVSAAGAGGGSIAYIDPSGRLQVGPKSAGASPGPACYGQGGENPTVTDANVILGYLDPTISWPVRASCEKIWRRRPLRKRSQILLASACLKRLQPFTTLSMHGWQARRMSLSRSAGMIRGTSPSVPPEEPPRFTLFGSWRNLGIKRLIIPKVAPIYCAFGMLFCDLKHDYQRAYLSETAKADLRRINELCGEMEKEAVDTLRREGIAEKDVIIEKSMEVRYYGQFRQRIAKVPAGPLTKESLAATINNFHEVHKNTVGYADPNYPTEIVRLHLSGIAKVSKPQLKRSRREEAIPRRP